MKANQVLTILTIKMFMAVLLLWKLYIALFIIHSIMSPL